MNFIRIFTFIFALFLIIGSLFYVNPTDELMRAQTAFERKDYDQCMRLARRAKIFLPQKDKAKADLLTARCAVKIKHSHIALDFLNEAAENDPQNSAVLLYKGDTELNIGLYKKAAADISKGLQIGILSEKEKAYFTATRGMAYAFIGDTARAADDWREAMKEAPELPEAFELKSYILENKGDAKGALEALEKAYQLYLQRNRLFFMSDEGRKLSERLVKLRVKQYQSRNN